MASERSSNVVRACEILLLLGEAGVPGMPLKTLADRLDDNKSATLRALAALAQHGFVETAGRRGHYRIGPAIPAIANRPTSTGELIRRFTPAVIAVAGDTGHSSYLLARAGFDAICVAMQAGTALVQTLSGGVGGRIPLGVGPGSTAILATLPEASADVILRHNLARYRSYPNTTSALVERSLKEARTLGFAQDFGATFPEAGGVAVAIRNGVGEAEGAISIALPAAGLDAGMARDLARRIETTIDAVRR